MANVSKKYGMTIIMPESLEAAKAQFAAEMIRRGYEVLGYIDAHWQTTMFRDTDDAYVTAHVRRKGNAVIQREEKHRQEYQN